ncbi:DUF2180 family protein [Streptomyces sp. JJ36]|uniref:DUF2180 family protein n=1 Tax=Streptomyces sp. JJ36 TaxID=2736645 RepID=UPI001F1C2642|nr:DUF2180 family protein [Streptomyces sp. JJ36]MCF6525366.1 DUF2180 family protein [Streptomyces sp. JJ36]
MFCYDCLPERETTAVAVCHRCGAGVCSEHVHQGREPVHEVHGTGVATQSTAARQLSCGVCHAAGD